MTKDRYPDVNVDNIKEKTAYSLLKIKRKIDSVEKLIFYIIPAVKEALFIQSPSLVYTSLDAKAFYQIEADLYNASKANYDKEINQNFDDLTNILGVVK